MSATIDTSSIIKQIEKIQAMVFCARETVATEETHEANMAAILLRDADNRIYDLKLAIDPHYGEVEEGGESCPA